MIKKRIVPIKSGVALIFENCDEIVIPMKYIDFLRLGEIRVSKVFDKGRRYTVRSLESIHLQINKDFFKKRVHYQFGIKDYAVDKLELLSWKNITGIEVDGELYSLPYETKNGGEFGPNVLQENFKGADQFIIYVGEELGLFKQMSDLNEFKYGNGQDSEQWKW